MNDSTETLQSDGSEFTLRLSIDSELGDLFDYLKGKSKRSREAVHLMRLGLMCLNGKAPATGGPVVVADAAGASKGRAAKAAPTLVPAGRPGGGKGEVKTGDGLQQLAALPDNFFAGPAG